MHYHCWLWNRVFPTRIGHHEKLGDILAHGECRNLESIKRRVSLTVSLQRLPGLIYPTHPRDLKILALLDD